MKIYFPIRRLSIFASAILFLVSCKPDKVKVYSSFYQYCPLKVGSYLIYNADSIKYTNSTRPPIADTVRYQIMDSVQSKFIDGTGQTVYRIQESRRSASSLPWTIIRAFSRSMNSLNVQETDGNNRYIKLIFPVVQNGQWNPDLYNTTDSSHILNAQYVQVHQPYSIQNFNFDSTVLVQLQNDTNLINHFVYYERYAAEVGLVSAEHDKDSITTDSLNSPNKSIGGYRFNQTLSDYGPR